MKGTLKFLAWMTVIYAVLRWLGKQLEESYESGPPIPSWDWD